MALTQLSGNTHTASFTLTALLHLFVIAFSVDPDQTLPPDIERDSKLPVPDLIRTYGYPVEVHTIETEDGYILTLHRIPHGATLRTRGKPVLVMHGVLSSAADWIVTGPKQALGYILADAGYDVWLGNFRGSTFSKTHVRYSPSSKEFWDFSWHENGEFDLPAMIDYILQRTGSRKLFYAGHSMGTTSFYVLMAIRPEYNTKIHVMCSLAPIAFMNNLKSPLLRQFSRPNRGEEWLLNALGVYELLPNNEIFGLANRQLCRDEAPSQELCSNIMFLITGWDSEQLNTTQLPVILSHFPAGASTKQLLHYGQEIVSGHFREWDYGAMSNMYFYGTAEPPDYNLSRIVAPVVLFYSENDWLSSVIDVSRLYAGLGNPVEMFRVPFEKFNHLDYLWAIDAKRLVYDHVIRFFKEFE